jgi:hypothetical protein
MTRRYLPPGDLLATALAGRVDALERETRDNTTGVTALGRGVADLTAQIRRLTDTPTAGTAIGEQGDQQDSEDDGEDVGQPDWFAVEDPQTARDILTALTAWVEAIGIHYGITLSVPCWVLHPDVVTDLLALSLEREGAYTGPKPTPVSEWLTRWLPATTERITQALAGCAADRAHRHHGHLYDTQGFDPLSAGTWWAHDRHTPAPEAFALPHLT